MVSSAVERAIQAGEIDQVPGDAIEKAIDCALVGRLVEASDSEVNEERWRELWRWVSVLRCVGMLGVSSSVGFFPVVCFAASRRHLGLFNWSTSCFVVRGWSTNCWRGVGGMFACRGGSW